ncbi:hypothetical protein FERRO_01320 [Ferrovum sp. JA12]|nr:hypothetical protein FERRO_01320 [Ferrovum sp. JA12]
MAGEDLGREFAAVFAGHGALDTLDDGGDGRAIVFKLLGDVGDADALAFADVFVIGRFVRVLKPAPAADVVDQDQVEIGVARFDIGNQLLQGGAATDGQAAFAVVGIGAHDLDAPLVGVLTDLVGLVESGVLLVFGGHAHVLGGAKGSGLGVGGGRGVSQCHDRFVLFVWGHVGFEGQAVSSSCGAYRRDKVAQAAEVRSSITPLCADWLRRGSWPRVCSRDRAAPWRDPRHRSSGRSPPARQRRLR